MRSTGAESGLQKLCWLRQACQARLSTSTPNPEPPCRAFAQRGVLDGPGLLTSLLSDVVQALVASAGEDRGDSTRGGAKGGASEAWVLASPFAAPDARDNAVGVCPVGVQDSGDRV